MNSREKAIPFPMRRAQRRLPVVFFFLPAGRCAGAPGPAFPSRSLRPVVGGRALVAALKYGATLRCRTGRGPRPYLPLRGCGRGCWARLGGRLGDSCTAGPSVCLGFGCCRAPACSFSAGGQGGSFLWQVLRVACHRYSFRRQQGLQCSWRCGTSEKLLSVHPRGRMPVGARYAGHF